MPLSFCKRYNGLVKKEIVSNFLIHVQGFSIANMEVQFNNFKFFKLPKKDTLDTISKPHEFNLI